jgi:predicted nuclease of predicted toxin-antitoxin system
MNFKLDENFGERTIALFRQNHHGVETVRSQGMSGDSDENLFEVCVRESRCLVTLDLDFADVLRFPPAKCAGVVVIRVPRNPSLILLEQLVSAFLRGLQTEQLVGRLWIVESNRIRVHQSEEALEN